MHHSAPSNLEPHSDSTQGIGRRSFLKGSLVALASGSILPSSLLASKSFSGGSAILKVGLIGCGGRGSGAAVQALRADKGTQLVAMADAFSDRLEKSLNYLLQYDVKDRIKVPEAHRFSGFDGYKKVLELVDVVILTSPPHFRPEHLAAAVAAGKHIFCEKPVAVDAPGVRSVLESCRKAKEKGLSLVSGLCWRYHNGMRATFDKIHEGAIGEIRTIQATYNTGGLWYRGFKKEWSQMENMVRNWLYYTWLSGDHIAEQHIHSLDKIAWAMNDEYPIKVTASGGRQVRTEAKYGNVYDHFNTVYEFKNGVKGFASCRQWNGAANDVSDHVYGTEGVCHVFKHQIVGKHPWKFKGKHNSMYQAEHDALFASIRKGEPINNGDYMVKSTLMAIMGRMAAYTGKVITWDEAWNSKERLGPEVYEWGQFDPKPVARPGITRFF